MLQLASTLSAIVMRDTEVPAVTDVMLVFTELAATACLVTAPEIRERMWRTSVTNLRVCTDITSTSDTGLY